MPSKRILLIDDEIHLTFALSVKLKQLGFEIETANNGQIGIEIACEWQPDLIVSDFQMPVLDGFEMCVQLAANEATADIPVIMLTARGHRIAPSEMARTNIQQLLAKPFSTRELLAHIESVLRISFADGESPAA